MDSSKELLREVQRLNKTGIINDEEFLILRKLLAGGRVSPEYYRRFDQLFAGHSKVIPFEEKNHLDKPQEKPRENNDRLYSMTEAINELNLNLTKSGKFDFSRELLSCPACQMFEDVNNDGVLITAELVDPEIDTGLRFTKMDNGKWECPDCGHLCSEK